MTNVWIVLLVFVAALALAIGVDNLIRRARARKRRLRVDRIEAVWIDGRVFQVLASDRPSVETGGFGFEWVANGDGSARRVMNLLPWQVSGLMLVVDEDQGDWEFLCAVADSEDEATLVFEKTSGRLWRGKGWIVDELELCLATSVVGVAFAGAGRLERA